MANLLKFNFLNSPTVARMQQSDAFVRGIKGPVGSGKSYGCAAEIFLRAMKQKPSKVDNIRYSRFAVVRNTYPELKTTTIKTYQDIYPADIFGNMNMQPPVRHHIKISKLEDGTGIDVEVLFLALDKPGDESKLLSLELTGAWINEARHLPFSIVDALTARVGRYPSKKNGGCSWRGIWMDTNAPDEDHWWYDKAVLNPISGDYEWNFYDQPPGVLEVKAEDAKNNEGKLIKAADCWWQTNPDAENLNNLPKGYYDQMVGGKSRDWINCYAQGYYGYVREGKPIWPEYKDDAMSGEFEPDYSHPLIIGMDFGLTPAAVIGQRLPGGAWRILDELVAMNMGLARFVDDLIAKLNNQWPEFNLPDIWGDPAGVARDSIYEENAFSHLRSKGFRARETSSNKFMVRRESGALPMTRYVDGHPGLMVHKRCNRLRRALSGGYHFRRVSKGEGYGSFSDEPVKNDSSHVGDAFGYLMLGGGEQRQFTRGSMNAMRSKPVIADTNFDVLAP